MNPEIKKLWVEALRSGKYRQGKNRLRNTDDSFCCLGVLCNLHAQAHPEVAAGQKKRTEYLGENALLPDQVITWAGLNSWNPIVEYFRNIYSLSYLNDKGVPFTEIADAIEKCL